MKHACYASTDTNTPIPNDYTCSLAVGGEDNRVEPAVVGGQEVRAGLRHFRLQATGHGYLVEERSTPGGHQGERK